MSAPYRDLVGHRSACEGGYALLLLDLDRLSNAPLAGPIGCPSQRCDGPPAHQWHASGFRKPEAYRSRTAVTRTLAFRTEYMGDEC